MNFSWLLLFFAAFGAAGAATRCVPGRPLTVQLAVATLPILVYVIAFRMQYGHGVLTGFGL